MIRRLFLPAALVALVLPAVPAAAAPPTGGHAGADAQNSSQYAVSGPAAPGLAFDEDTGYELRNEPRQFAFTSAGDLVLQGRAFTEQARVPVDTVTGAESRGVLDAIDPDDGSFVWDAPAVDIARECAPAATSDGFLWAQNESNSEVEDSNSASIVMLDAATGERVPGAEYDSTDEGTTDLDGCENRGLLLSEDEQTLAMLSRGGGNEEIRFFDVSDPQAITHQSVELLDDDGDRPAVIQELVMDPDRDIVYAVYRSDRDTTPPTWTAVAVDFDATVLDELDLAGDSASPSEATMVAVDGGFVIGLDQCGTGEGNSDECLARYAFDGTTLTEDWLVREPDTGGNQFMKSLARLGEDRLVGWSEVDFGGAVTALDLADGSILWTTQTSSFSNNGNQIVVDADGNSYIGAFGGATLESFDRDGNRRFQLPGCRYGVGEPAVLAGIAPNGTLMAMFPRNNPDGDNATQDSTERVFGFATDGDTPRGECPQSDERAAGPSRVETAIEVSGTSFPEQDSTDTVVIAVSTNYPDALSGGPLARFLDAPLLLTEGQALNPDTRAEIERLGATTAVLLGGTVALSQAVEAELDDDMGLTVDRIAGASRFDTARLIAGRLPAGGIAYVTEGRNAIPTRGWPDAVAVSALASFTTRPILLVEQSVAPQETLDALDELGITDARVIGGTVAVSEATADALTDPDGDGTDEVTVTRTSGESRYDTSVMVAEASRDAGASTLSLWFATGRSYPDALTAGPAAAKAGGILILVDGQNPDGGPEVYDFLRDLSDQQIQDLTFVGGTAAISDAVADALIDAADLP